MGLVRMGFVRWRACEKVACKKGVFKMRGPVRRDCCHYYCDSY